ncbi:hypothetical protein BC937DRAFT_94643 [Endogone sp. FLAS-F59071]|nr:hypothetical protein BC937DRAFT_94643 [Endogone sp. FLAS-F59071]|eukprot:RUS13878.1 hypothetical protein BC937DRAFT_94643 [Endogone sp. FLAS-F59071]
MKYFKFVKISGTEIKSPSCRKAFTMPTAALNIDSRLTITRYPFQDLLDTTTNTLNQTAFKGTLFFGYASFISAYVYVILFEGPRLKKVFARLFTREKRQDKDLLNKLMSAYDEVPVWYA